MEAETMTYLKYLKSERSLLSTKNWERRMGPITIEQFCSDNDFVVVEVPDEIEDPLMRHFIDNIFSQELYDADLEIKNAHKEIESIKQWFNDNDYLISKKTLGEITEDDIRWQDYIYDRQVKSARLGELEVIIGYE